MTKFLPLLSILLCLPHFGSAADEGQEQINALLTAHSGIPVSLKHGESIATKATFKPPVEITIVAKSESSDLRLGYAANQVIFNWEGGPTELRVDGGPGSGKHRPGFGAIPTKKYVTFRWRVTSKKQTIFVDGQQRFEHEGDYLAINNPVSVAAHGSAAMVKSIKVLQLPAGTE